MPGCFLCCHISAFHHWLHWSLVLRSSPRSKLSRALSHTGKLALSEDTMYSRIEDTVRWRGRKGKSELEKHSRELKGRRRWGLVKSARTCGEKHSARQALKLHSKAAGVKQCQSCETHRTPLAKTQPRVRETWHPNQTLASRTKYAYSRYIFRLWGILPLRKVILEWKAIPIMDSFPAHRPRQRHRTHKQTTTHTHTHKHTHSSCCSPGLWFEDVDKKPAAHPEWRWFERRWERSRQTQLECSTPNQASKLY